MYIIHLYYIMYKLGLNSQTSVGYSFSVPVIMYRLILEAKELSRINYQFKNPRCSRGFFKRKLCDNSKAEGID